MIQHVIDYEKDLNPLNETNIRLFDGADALFNCLGTTRGQAGSAEEFVRVEVGLSKVSTHTFTHTYTHSFAHTCLR